MSSDFLFAQPSFLRGVARIVDLAGTFNKAYNRSFTGEEADARALYSDWTMVAQDLGDANAVGCDELPEGPNQLQLSLLLELMARRRAQRRRQERRQADLARNSESRMADPAAPADAAPQRSVATFTQIGTSWQGPLPPPNILQAYNNTFPGCAQRLVEMAERQSEHHKPREHGAEGNLRQATRGQYIGAFLAAGALAGGIWLLSIGRSIEGYTTLIANAAVSD